MFYNIKPVNNYHLAIITDYLGQIKEKNTDNISIKIVTIVK